MEVNSWFTIAGGTLMIMVFAAPMASSLQTTFRGLLAKSYQIPTDGPALTALMKTLGFDVLAAFGVPLLLLCVAAFAGNIVQHRIVFTTELVRPQLSRISPMAGFARLFSRQALANFAKGLAKLCVVGGVMAVMLWPQRQRLGSIVTGDPAMLLPFVRSIALKLLGTVVAVLAVIATADYLFQYRQWYERQKMSLQEIKEEFRQTEGYPTIKGKASPIARDPHAKAHHRGGAEGFRGHHQPDPLRDRSQIRARHERTGLRRQRRRPDRPQDPRDRRRAPHSVVENPPLARALHATVEIDQEIPQEHYRAVAEIIGYVMGLKRNLSGGRRV